MNARMALGRNFFHKLRTIALLQTDRGSHRFRLDILAGRYNHNADEIININLLFIYIHAFNLISMDSTISVCNNSHLKKGERKIKLNESIRVFPFHHMNGTGLEGELGFLPQRKTELLE